jgi:hypothetical protein
MTEASTFAIEEPNLFTLTGRDLTVSLTLSGIDGKPHFSYHDSHQAKEFSGDDITIEETALGTLASVVIVTTVDAGYTSFTLLLPRVNLIGATSHAIHTLGITATHRTTIAGLGHGQLTNYHSSHLHGSASQVQF